MYAHRTLASHARYGCLVGCCLAGFASAPVLAAVNSNGIELLSANSTGVKTGQYIEAAASARYQHVNTAQRIYTKALVPVATSTLRTGALAALSRGITHPGLLIAVTAAGYLLQGDEVQAPVINPYDQQVDDFFSQYGTVRPNPYYYFGSTCGGSSSQTTTSYAQNTIKDNPITYVSTSTDFGGTICIGVGSVSRSFRFFVSSTSNPYDPAAFGIGGEPDYGPATQEDLEALDPHIPPQLFDELTNGNDLPEWRDAITVLGAPASLVVPTGDQQVAPEVATKVGQWAENVAAQLDGEPLPNPETDATGVTAEDKLVEDLDLDGDVPPYPEPEVDWQTETLSLPSYSSGVGPGQCPAPVSIPLPLTQDVVSWSYQPACDAAEMIRPAFLGFCGFVSLLIVLRARGGNG